METVGSHSSAGVSVCLPTFNGEQFLHRAIESILRQTHRNFELLISDDGSSDGTVAIIKDFAKRDSRIRWWRNERNLGLFPNYNECFRQAKFSYIKPFAQDDVLSENNLSTVLSLFEKHPTVSLIATKRSIINDEDEDISDLVGALSSDMFLASDRVVSGYTAIRQSLDAIANFIGEPSAVTLRKSACGTGFDTAFHHLGDLDLWLRALRGGDYYFCTQPLASFRLHDGSRSRTNIKELMFVPDLLRLAQNFEDLFADFGINYEDHVCKIARGLAGHIGYLLSSGEVTADSVKANTAEEAFMSAFSKQESFDSAELGRMTRELLLYREMAFTALHELSKQQAGNAQYYDPLSEEITQAESRLAGLLESPSWRMTRMLRDCNAMTFRVRPITAGSDAPQQSLNEPALYLQYLRRQIQLVKQSRSWRITGRLRKLGVL